MSSLFGIFARRCHYICQLQLLELPVARSNVSCCAAALETFQWHRHFSTNFAVFQHKKEKHEIRGIDSSEPENKVSPQNLQKLPQTKFKVDEITNTFEGTIAAVPIVEDDEDTSILYYYIEKAENDMQFLDDIDYVDITDPNKRLFYKMIDVWIKEAGVTRRGHREFIQASINCMKKFKVDADISAYLKLLDCFPEGEHTGIKRSHWFKAAYHDKIPDHALALQLFRAINYSGAIPNDKLFNKATDLFGRFSPATWSARQLLFWYPRLVAFCKHPVSVSALQEMSPVEIAFSGLRQMNPGIDAEYKHFPVNKSKFDEVLDADKIDFIISVQTPDQKSLLAQHDPNMPIYIEGPNMVYYKQKAVKYFVLRCDPKDVQPTLKSKNAHILTSKEWWSQFYQTEWTSDKKLLKGSKQLYPNEQFLPTLPLEKGLEDTSERIRDICQVDQDTEKHEGPVYAIACTDYQSPIALQSWIHGLASESKVLQQCTVVFHEEEAFLINAPNEDPYEEDEYENFDISQQETHT